jgi:hypothetical protein
MTHHSTIWMALDLLQSPSGVKRLRASPLPDDVNTLLRIAAGDDEAANQAADATRQSPNKIREAAAFYVEQILLHPDADHYRVLGARPDASAAELRRNMAWLIRWLHPDQHNGGERSVFAGRVTKAWSELKTEERRAAYDLSRRKALAKKSAIRDKKRGQQQSSTLRPYARGNTPRSHRQLSRPAHHPGILTRVMLMLFGKTLN